MALKELLPEEFRKRYIRPTLRVFTDRSFHLKKYYIWPLMRRFRHNESYQAQFDAEEFFDQFHGISETADDSTTISPGYSPIKAEYHYNLVENGIIAHFLLEEFEPRDVLDVGSGTGHWMNFYLSFFELSAICGVDISAVSVDKLRNRFSDNPIVRVLHGDVLDQEEVPDASLDLINAVGVLFHIVSDEKWERTMEWCYRKLRPGGMLIAGGFMGLLTANVQFAPAKFDELSDFSNRNDVVCNKRVRSLRYWKKTLRRCGFTRLSLSRTRSVSHIHTPENNLLFARKAD
jgi:SAM-dependent methyltransferase